MADIVAGDVYIDKDALRGNRPFRVIMVVKQPDFVVRKPTAVCICRGKVTSIGLDRLQDASRFYKSEELEFGS